MGSSYYIDCYATTASEGTIDAPWNDLEEANSITLGPGDHLLLRRGTSCNGMLKPQGSGTADNRIHIGAYGDGSSPRIDAQGMYSAAVHLDDMSHLVIRDLELTNPGNLSEPHRGVYLTTTEAVVTNVEIRDLYIHDVTGLVTFNGTAKRGGAIIGNSSFFTPETQFDGVLIENNRIEDVGRSGIYFDGSSASTSDRPPATEHWAAGGQGIVIRGNTLKRLQGDGVVAHGTAGAVIEDNVVSVGNLAGSYDGIRMYNITFVMPNPHTALETFPFETLSTPGDFQFANNIIYATSPQTTLIGCGDRCTNNLFYNLPPEADYLGNEIPTNPAIGMHQPL